MAKIVDSVEALRFVLTATKGDPNIRAFEVPRNVAEDLLSELDHLRKFVSGVRAARANTLTYHAESDAIEELLGALDARATGGEGTT